MSVPDLFKPLTLLHGLAMRNRLMMAPLTGQQSEHDGTASEFDKFWKEQLAQSGYASWPHRLIYRTEKAIRFRWRVSEGKWYL